MRNSQNKMVIGLALAENIALAMYRPPCITVMVTVTMLQQIKNMRIESSAIYLLLEHICYSKHHTLALFYIHYTPLFLCNIARFKPVAIGQHNRRYSEKNDMI